MNLALFDKILQKLEVKLEASYTFGITAVIKIRLFGKSLQVLEFTYSYNLINLWTYKSN